MLFFLTYPPISVKPSGAAGKKQDVLLLAGRPCEEFRKSFFEEMWYKVRIKMLGLG